MVVVAPAVVCGSVMLRWKCVCGGGRFSVCIDRLFMKTVRCIAIYVTMETLITCVISVPLCVYIRTNVCECCESNVA